MDWNNQKKFKSTSVTIFQDKSEKKNLFLHIFCWILLFMKIARIDPQGICCISSSKRWNFSWRKRLSKRLFMLCFHIICSWRQKCQSLLVLAELWCHAGLKPNVLSVLTTPLMIYQYSSKLKDSQIIMSEMLYQFEKMRLSGKNKKKQNNEDKNSTNAKALSSQWQTNLPAWSVIKVLIISVDTQDNYFTRVSQPTYCDFLESF